MLDSNLIQPPPPNTRSEVECKLEEGRGLYEVDSLGSYRLATVLQGGCARSVWRKMTVRRYYGSHHAVVLVASLALLALNLYDAWVLSEQQKLAASGVFVVQRNGE